MTPRRAATAIVLLLVVPGVGCRKEDVPTKTYLASTTTTAPPRAGVIGERVLFAQVDLVVSDITAFERSPDGVPRIRAVIRTENFAAVDRSNPTVGLVCDEAPDPGEWSRGSTWEPAAILPAGAVNQGEALVGFPAKPGAPLYSVAACTDAVLRVEMGGPSLGRQRIDYPVPAEVITESLDRPLGHRLPLPLETR